MKSTTRKIIAVLFLGIVNFGASGYKAIKIPALKDESIVISLQIRSGASVGEIANKLKRAELISSTKWFRLYTRITAKDIKIRSGLYKIRGGLNMIEVVDYITHNNQEIFFYPNKLTIPEGLALEQIAQKLLEAKLGTQTEINKLFHDQDFIKTQLGVDATSLEGFIFPKTYFYKDDITLQDFLITYPLNEFKKEYGDYLADPSFYKNLILASIVEKEFGAPSEKPIVASVFKNRLKKGMALASCATHNKIFFKDGKIPPKVLLNIHLDIDSPYNTYKYIGLPPTPICSPSKESFEAVVSGENTDYLYFFADFKGNNVFSVTYQEHNRKKRSVWHSDSLAK